MKILITTWWHRGGFTVQKPGPEVFYYQVIAPDVQETVRAGKGYDGLQADMNYLLERKAEEMAALYRAQGHEVTVFVQT